MEDKVKLVSSDNAEFFLDYAVAIQSQTLRSFFSRPSMFTESLSREVALPVKALYLRRVVEFLEFRRSSDPNKDPGEFRIEDDETLELLDIAAYLKI